MDIESYLRSVSTESYDSFGRNAATITDGTNFSSIVPVSGGSNTVTVIANDQSNPILSSTSRYAVTVASGSSTTTGMSYDSTGNLTGDATRTFEWDSRNRLKAVNKGMHRTEFTYDGLDRRVRVIEKEMVNGNYTEQSNKRLVWVGMEIAEERDGVTNARTKSYNGNEMTIVTGTNEVTYFYTRDHLGSVREMTSGTGAGITVRARYDYDPYGRRSSNLIAANPVEADFGYTGHYEHIASGLTLAPYRAYDAGLGRWISRDPLDDAEMLQEPNLYLYVRNDPANGIDPLGLWQVTVYGGTGWGGYVSFGRNSGQWNVSAKVGGGLGLSASFDPHDSGCKKPGFGFTGTVAGGLGEGYLGGGFEATGDSNQGSSVTVNGRAGVVGGSHDFVSGANSAGASNYGASGFIGGGVSWAGH